MDPTVWGPHYWMFLHTVAAHYPKHPNAIVKKIHFRLFHNFYEFIPHHQISATFSALLNEYPVTPYLDSRDKLMEWVNFIHNKVNELTNKPKIDLATHKEMMRELYTSKSKKWKRYTKNNFLVVSFAFIVMLAAIVYMYKP